MFLINRVPSKVLSFATPLKIFFLKIRAQGILWIYLLKFSVVPCLSPTMIFIRVNWIHMHKSVCFLGILQIKRGINVLILSLKNTLLQWMCSFLKINHFLSLQVRGSKQISKYQIRLYKFLNLVSYFMILFCGKKLTSLLHFPIRPILSFIRIIMVLKIVHLLGRIWKTNSLFYSLWKHKIYN